MAAVEERLAVIRSWIKRLGLGDLEAAAKALYESWVDRNSHVPGEGLSRSFRPHALVA
jgi:hypothetical protein